MGSYGALWRARLQLIRPGNVLMAAAGVLTGFLVAVSQRTDLDGLDWLPGLSWLAPCLSAAFITAFGNVLNDLKDVDIDRQAHSERPLVTGALTPQTAKLFAVFLLFGGIWSAFVAGAAWHERTGALQLVAFAGANALLLWSYETWAKARPLIGNVVVSALVASTFVFGDLAAPGRPVTDATWLIAGLAALANLARELVKDVEDAEADAAHRRTLAHVLGHRWTLALAAGCLVGAVLLSLTMILDPWYPIRSAVLLIIADGVFIAAAATGWVRPRLAQQAMKGGMLLALVAFILETFP